MLRESSRVRRWVHLAVVAGLVSVGGAAVVGAPPAAAAPTLGYPALTVLACRFADRPATPTTTAALGSVVRGSGASLSTWVRNTSRSHASLGSARVHGWFTMSLTLDGLGPRATPTVLSACRTAAVAAGVVLPPRAPVLTVVNDGDFTPQTTEPWGGLLRWDAPLGAWAHQFGHALGLAEAWSHDPATGEYRRGDDEYSVMGNWSSPWPLWPRQPQVLGLGPKMRGLGAYELDRLSWLDERKIFTVGTDGNGTVGVRLSSVDVPSTAATDGYELIRVPADPADPTHYYTVELRLEGRALQPDLLSWDGIRIHEVRGGIPILLRDNSIKPTVDEEVGPFPLDHGRDPRRSVSTPTVSIGYGGDDGVRGSSIEVVVTTTAAAPCRPGWVPRRATPRDSVCVSPDRAAVTAAWNADAASRAVPGSTDAAGRAFCRFPYVWREANVLDSVCVTTGERSVAAEENRLTRDRVDASRRPLGPNWCAPGYVWREADGYDHVCVDPARRAAVAAENTRRCLWGDVSRSAWAADPACVTPASRAAAQEENSLAPTRLARSDG